VEGIADEQALAWSFCTIPLTRAARKDWPMSRGQMIVIRLESDTRWVAPAKHPRPALCFLDSFDDFFWLISAGLRVWQAEA
jgi:hypothetical protein